MKLVIKKGDIVILIPDVKIHRGKHFKVINIVDSQIEVRWHTMKYFFLLKDLKLT